MGDPGLNIGHPDAGEVPIGAEEIHRPSEEELSHPQPLLCDLPRPSLLDQVLCGIRGERSGITSTVERPAAAEGIELAEPGRHERLGNIWVPCRQLLIGCD